MIFPGQFNELLDCLAGQFFKNKLARCTGERFGKKIIPNARDYFSVAIITEELPRDLVVLGVLFDDSAYIASRNGFTFTIYIDKSKIDEDVFEIFSSIIIAHEICHFAFYYELFLKLGGNTGIITHSNFTHVVSGTLMDAITKEQNSTYQTIFDEHDIRNLLRNIRKFPKKHFSKGKETKINYQKLLDGFLRHIHYDKMLAEYLGKMNKFIQETKREFNL